MELVQVSYFTSSFSVTFTANTLPYRTSMSVLLANYTAVSSVGQKFHYDSPLMSRPATEHNDKAIIKRKWSLRHLFAKRPRCSGLNSKVVSFLYSETCFERPLPWEITCLEGLHFPGRRSYISMQLNLSPPKTTWLERPYFLWPMGRSFKTGSTVVVLKQRSTVLYSATVTPSPATGHPATASTY